MITNLIHPARRLWALPLLLILILLIAQCFGDPGRSLLAFDHSLIAVGPGWRLIPGSYVHLGCYHLRPNEIRLLVRVLLCPRPFHARVSPHRSLLISPVLWRGLFFVVH